jgi:hypothetical protein
VTDELENTPSEKRDKMLALIKQYNINVLASSDEANKLAMLYISKGALPRGSLIDARHIAIASVNALNIIVSLNFKHIVREKTINLTGTINTSLGYKTVKIQSPTEVIKNEKI